MDAIKLAELFDRLAVTLDSHLSKIVADTLRSQQCEIESLKEEIILLKKLTM